MRKNKKKQKAKCLADIEEELSYWTWEFICPLPRYNGIFSNLEQNPQNHQECNGDKPSSSH